MIKLTELVDLKGHKLDLDKIEQLISDGYVSRRHHNDFPLAILNYTHQAQFNNIEWGPELMACRGLIYNTNTLDVIARPLTKFWNYNDSQHPETLPENLPAENPTVTDKLDGSLGILYAWNGQVYVATRGRFHSEQAEWASAWIQQQYPRLQLSDAYTVLAEIIYPENRIVIKYEYSGLTVLSIVMKNDGREVSYAEVQAWCRAVNIPFVAKFNKTLAECASENISQREGYVLTYPSSGLKIKVKFEEYCCLHKILTNLNIRSIWELLQLGQQDTITLWVNDPTMRKDFKQWVTVAVQDLTQQHAQLAQRARLVFAGRPDNATRKQTAEYFLQEHCKDIKGLLFLLLDGKNIDNSVWEMIKPSGSTINNQTLGLME